MLAWLPPANSEKCNPLADAQSLVRFLGGLPAKDFPPNQKDLTKGDVVYRTDSGSLRIRWDLVFGRLDPFVNNSIHPIIVLDNVPWAFAPAGASKTTGYGNSMGPENVTEYGGFIAELLKGIVGRYGIEVARTFWYRVSTEPNTQPAHWNDTNAKWIDMYVAVAAAVRGEVPGAKVGTANFASDGPTRQENWDAVIVPMVKGIVARGAPVDFTGISCYGRAIECDEPGPKQPVVAGATDRGKRDVDKTCEYSPQSAAECARRIAKLRDELLPVAERGIPMQVMEYGDQQNKRKIVNPQPGAWGGAWTLASSVQFAMAGIERAFHWGFAEP